MLKSLLLSLMTALVVTTIACETTDGGGGGGAGETPAIEDTSASGMAASSIASVLASTSASHAILSSAPCPTLATLAGGGCTQDGVNVVDLSYSACTLTSSDATFTGLLRFSDDTGITCGTFPNTTMERQFVSLSSAPSTGTRTSATRVVTIDHATNNLGNYQADPIPPTVDNGYGSKIIWNSNVRTQTTINQRIFSPGTLNYSISGTVDISETAVSTAQVVTGTVLVYDNRVKVKGTAIFNSVVYNNTCCGPIGGSITTSFASTSASGAAGIARNGSSETLTFISCGRGVLSTTYGVSTQTVSNTCL